ncbi:MAG: hypothetical protein R3D34_06830 [Nitratireductor sp.]
MQAKERLWLTADQARVVPEGHKDAATLYAAVGDEIPASAAERYGIVNGAVTKALKAGEGGEPGEKQAGKGEDKQAGKGGNKGGKQDGNQHAGQGA